MKLKVFNVRLSKEHMITDQEAINNFIGSVNIKKTFVEFVNGQAYFWSILIFYDDKKNEIQSKFTKKVSILEESDLTVEELQIYEALKRWRNEKASQLNVPSYVVFHNVELMTVAKVKPQTLEDLSSIKGFGGQKISKYGDEILIFLNSV